jgi:hypothetical protein
MRSSKKILVKHYKTWIEVYVEDKKIIEFNDLAQISNFLLLLQEANVSYEIIRDPPEFCVDGL